MNEYIANIEDKKYLISSDDFNIVKIDKNKINIKIDKISEYSYKLKFENKVYIITTSRINDGKRSFLVNGNYFEGSIRTLLEDKVNEYSKTMSSGKSAKTIKSPMPGLVLKITKKVGEKVEAGESLLLLEAMKMENDLKAVTNGVIKEILVNVGSSVEKNETLIILD